MFIKGSGLPKVAAIDATVFAFCTLRISTAYSDKNESDEIFEVWHSEKNWVKYLEICGKAKFSEVEYIEENLLRRSFEGLASTRMLSRVQKYSRWQLHLVVIVVGTTRRLGICWLICGTVIRVELSLLLNHLLAQKSRVNRVLRRLVCHLRRAVTPSGCSSVLLHGGKALA